MARTGAEADALSTSFMIMSEGEILDYIKHHPDVGGIIFNEEGGLMKYGTLK